MDDTERQYLWWLEENHPNEYRLRIEKEDWEHDWFKEQESAYRKPIYNPFEVFTPTKTFIMEVKKQLIKQSYEYQDKKNNTRGQEREAIEQAHQKVISRIKQLDFYLKGGKNKKDIGETEVAQAKGVSLADLYGEPLRRQGRNLIGRCPFHSEKTASFTVYTRNNSWYCFGGCGTGGDSIAYIMKRDGLTFIEAVKYLLGR